MSLKRKLTQKEIDTICYVIKPNPFISKDVATTICQNLRENISTQLSSISVYPEIIPTLKETIQASYEQSVIQPGEMVGTIAASSIGESTTQASLNSFHQSGLSKVNLTGGLVRQQELLNASKNVKTPSCTIYLNKELIDSTDLYKVIEFANENLIYYEFEHFIDSYEISKCVVFDEKEEEYYDFFSRFYDDSWKECEYRIRYKINKRMLYRTKKDLEYIANVIYSIVDQKREKLSIVYFPMNENNEFIMDVWVKPSIEEIEQIIKMITKKKKSLIVTDKVRERLNEIVNDDNKMLKYVENIIVNILKKLPISGIFGIEECYYSEDKKKEWHIDTKGSNLEQLVYHPYIDYKRTRSNNMYDILKLFGIEATNKFLYEEFSKIISVNKRHLDMLINSMTANGSIMSVNRYGIDRKQVGPLAKACFEQPVDNFMYSATKGEIDPLRGVSSNVCVGKLNKVGTGMVDLFIDMKKTDKYYNELYKDNKEEVTEEQDENEYIDDVEFY